MSTFELKLPQMGESVAEATLTAWLKEVGDTIDLDDPIFEIATDKVDSEVPSVVEGVLLERRFAVDDVIKVGEVVAVIQVEGEGEAPSPREQPEDVEPEAVGEIEQRMEVAKESVSHSPMGFSNSQRFYSPWVRTFAGE